ncbi:MAG: hypothetical protein ACI9UA_004270, partial [Pseudoalteromonas tetraodonis]
GRPTCHLDGLNPRKNLRNLRLKIQSLSPQPEPKIFAPFAPFAVKKFEAQATS